MQFIKGVDEPTVPEVSLRRARNGSSGSATLLFENPSIFQASGELGEITGGRPGGGRAAAGRRRPVDVRPGAAARARGGVHACAHAYAHMRLPTTHTRTHAHNPHIQTQACL